MNISVITHTKAYQANRLFNLELNDLEPHSHNSHWMLKPWSKLYSLAQGRQINLFTSDLLKPEKADGVLLMDLHISRERLLNLQSLNPKCKWTLLILESPLFNQHGLSVCNHRYFDKVLTYNRELNDSPKYIHFNLPIEGPPLLDEGIPFDQRKFSCLVNRNQSYGVKKRLSYIKRTHHMGWRLPVGTVLSHVLNPQELYTFRSKIVSVFEKQMPNDLDVFGEGWSGPCARGSLSFSKLKLLLGYKFNFCIENVKNDSHYVSEKIFDSVFSGSVPVYIGYNSIDQIVPKEACVLASKFKNIFQLLVYLKTMNAQQWNQKRMAAKEWLQSKEYLKFDSSQFSDAVLSALLV